MDAGIKPVKRTNSLNTIRLLAALQVFAGHAIPNLGLELPQWLTSILHVLFVFEGVPVFFFLSGFLIWSSIGKTRDFKTYLQKRVLRIYPELWGGVLVSMIAMLVLYGKQIVWPDFLAFQVTQSTALQFWTPDSLRNYGTGTPNPSLWTIGVMAQCYIALWFLHKLLHRKHWAKWAACIGVSMCVNIFKPLAQPFLPALIYKLVWYTFANHIWLFLIGAFICEHFDKVLGFLKKFWWAALLLSVVAKRSGWDVGGYLTFQSIFLGLGCIGMAYSLPQINIKNDYSYGLYIYHMIVINAMVALGVVGENSYMLIALAVSFLLAVLSYHTLGALSRNMKRKTLLQQEQPQSGL